jgi:hypothetical protein
MLARWANFAPGTRMPEDLSQLPAGTRLELENADAELFALLSNTAHAELELAAMNNQLAERAPDPQQRQTAAIQAEVEQLISAGAFPVPGFYREDGSYQAPISGNLTAQLRVAALDPARYEAEMLKANPPQQGGLSEADAAWVNAEAQRVASLNLASGAQG